VGTWVSAHDRSKAVVIDPSISVTYEIFLGGTGTDSVTSVAEDAAGNLYLGGPPHRPSLSLKARQWSDVTTDRNRERNRGRRLLRHFTAEWHLTDDSVGHHGKLPYGLTPLHIDSHRNGEPHVYERSCFANVHYSPVDRDRQNLMTRFMATLVAALTLLWSVSRLGSRGARFAQALALIALCSPSEVASCGGTGDSSDVSTPDPPLGPGTCVITVTASEGAETLSIALTLNVTRSNAASIARRAK
jgi:hypothetical protein